jgi:hypothetical protein
MVSRADIFVVSRPASPVAVSRALSSLLLGLIGDRRVR